MLSDEGFRAGLPSAQVRAGVWGCVEVGGGKGVATSSAAAGMHTLALSQHGGLRTTYHVHGDRHHLIAVTVSSTQIA